MPVGRIESPPSASFPRDCSHECRVCRVSVVGLSTYAKHISSQLHKDNVDAQEKEEEKEEAEEEYFDKELIQLINQRKEQSRQEEASSSSKEIETDGYQQRRGDNHLIFQDRGPQEWRHCDQSERDWQWRNDYFKNSRKGNFLHSSQNVNPNRSISSARGRAGWHVNGTANRHLIHGKPGGSWHSNAGGPTSWHHRGTGRNFHWHKEGNGILPLPYPRNGVMNWSHNPYGVSQWGFGPNGEAFNQGRNRPLRNYDSTHENDAGWNKKKVVPKKFSTVRFTWKKAENTNSGAPCLNSVTDSSENTDDFTSDKLPEDHLFGFKMSEKSDKSAKNSTSISTGKNNISSRDKTHRFAPYPPQKGIETEQTSLQNLETDIPLQTCEARKEDITNDQEESMDKCKTIDKDKGKISPDFSDEQNDQSELKRSRMPSLKSPLRSIPDIKSSALKRDQKNPLKGVKQGAPMSVGERQTRLSALNLETVRSNSYISKLRSASRTLKNNQETQESSTKESDETLSEVLRKAKEMLHNSQSLQSPYFHPLKEGSTSEKTVATDVLKESKTTNSHEHALQNESDLSENAGMLENPCESHNTSDNCEHAAEYIERTSKSLEHGIISSSTDTCPMESSSEPVQLQEPSELNEYDNGSTSQYQTSQEDESFEIVSDPDLHKSANLSSSPILPELSKLGLPASLQRDLTRHISLRSKAGTHLPEPNLNNARRIRNVSGHRKSETEKDSGIKPTLRQLLNVSRRNINWEQVMQNVNKKRQEQGKGLPRFGIEMVAQVQGEQEGLEFEETDLNIENFHWECVSTPLGASRKRSLSESSLAVEKASVYIFSGNGSDTSGERSIQSIHSSWKSGPCVRSTENLSRKIEEGDAPVLSPGPITYNCPSPPPIETPPGQNSDLQSSIATDCPQTPNSAGEDGVLSVNVSTANVILDGGTDSCTSGTEQYDGQGGGKKRRATGDGSCPEIPSLERNTKRRRIRGRKERSQVDQLLSISLKEEELNHSLEGADNNLLQARTALQAAYVEVQRLLVLKQQITMEMSSLRTQRIQILQGLQGSFDSANNVTEEQSNRPQTIPVVPSGNVFSFMVETPSYISPSTSLGSALSQSPVRVCTSQALQPPSVASTAPDSSVSIKQEPMSPEREGENMTAIPQSPVQPVMSPQTNGGIEQSTTMFPIITATMSLAELTDQFPIIHSEPSLDRHVMPEMSSPPRIHTPINIESNILNSSEIKESLLESCSSSTQDQAFPLNVAPEGRNNCLAQLEEEQAESTLIMIETKSGKKKKKLRKKKTFRATHVPENSDTELDIYADKPVRKIKSRRSSKETIVSTSTSQEQEPGAATQEIERHEDDLDSDSNVELLEIPNPQFEVVAIDSEEEKPDSPIKEDLSTSREGNSEANDEVTSTSELGTNYANENLKSLANNRRASLRGSKTSSAEVSSEPGEDEDPTEGSFEGHQSAVNSIQIFGGLLYTCSADKTVRVYNLVTRQCVGVFEGHTSKVNCLLVTQTHGKVATLFTGSSDHTIRCYSVKPQEFLEQLELGERILCLHARWRILYAGLANGTVVTFSLKNNKQIDVFECHGPRAVSCLATAQEGARRLLLVGSYDCTITVRDARNGLLLRTLEGHTKTVLCMKVVNDLVFSGSSDQSVHAHNIHTGELVRIYKGHNHAVTVVNILGKVMVTACLDKFVRVYELQSHDRLQVYGGHSDMIMCMAIHKSMIYTGCYDGSIQAVQLNLMQNYRCWWHGCSLIFGVVDHLKQHLLTDHTNPNFQSLKCRWKNCDAFFTSRRGSKQDAVGHIERHAEEDSRINS
ncbi:zinc finger protein 106 [Bombina bombina]|uniref:zinc finger protein 106 n=1 Tax=Bombina bombina TaxID=8345 RepID=UPI00235AC2CE|nr:zinc finger protein 106 [Bombina bombina]